jgi:hypothetical protein
VENEPSLLSGSLVHHIVIGVVSSIVYAPGRHFFVHQLCHLLPFRSIIIDPSTLSLDLDYICLIGLKCLPFRHHWHWQIVPID